MNEPLSPLPEAPELTFELDAIEGVLKGVSAIDRHRLYIQSLAEADAFIKTYGYRWDNAEDQSELKQTFAEACSFIERLLLPEPEQLVHAAIPDPIPCLETALTMPEAMHQLEDLRELLLFASDLHHPLCPWACVILKVMHTICHIDNTLLYQFYDEAKQQIVARYYDMIYQDGAGQLWLGSKEGLHIAIAGIEVKDKKSRDSMILKLLCKKENVAETVFDLIGIRIITHTVADALLALEVLRRHNVVMFTNIVPSRSRNSLVDIDDFKDKLANRFAAVDESLPQDDLFDLFSTIPVRYPKDDKRFNPDNPSSSDSYRAIHITDRPLVRIKTPGHPQQLRFYFPYELQLVDMTHHHQNLTGQSAHVDYKRNKLRQARHRVLGPLLQACFIWPSPSLTSATD